MNNPSTAVVILNWNGANLLHKFLPSVLAGTASTDAAVIVVDNGSTDNSLSVLATEFPQVRTILFSENYGFAGGYNRAVDQLQDEFRYVVLLNSDVAVQPGWIRPLIDFMEANARIGACQPKILSFERSSQFEYAGAAGGFIDKNGYPYCRGRLFDTCETDTGQYDEPIRIFWASGAALMIRTELYLSAGGLDAEFFAHMEEIDLCWRLQLSGYQIWCVPTSVVYHLGGGSLPAGNPRKTYLNFRNNLLLLHKNIPLSERKRMLFKRRLLDTVAWAKFILTFDFKNASAILKAHRDYRKMSKNYNLSPHTNLLKSFPQSRVNIIVDYYLRRIRNYSRLPFNTK